jgi:hypothetical protein
MRCTTFQDVASNWSILEGVCEPRSTPSSVKIEEEEECHKLVAGTLRLNTFHFQFHMSPNAEMRKKHVPEIG